MGNVNVAAVMNLGIFLFVAIVVVLIALHCLLVLRASDNHTRDMQAAKQAFMVYDDDGMVVKSAIGRHSEEFTALMGKPDIVFTERGRRVRQWIRGMAIYNFFFDANTDVCIDAPRSFGGSRM